MTETNPYTAPREQEPASEPAPEPVSPGARLVARLWFAGLLGCLVVGGLGALVLRWSAWNAQGINPHTYNAVHMVHGSLMAVGVVPGAVMASASLVGAGMRERTLAALTWLGVAAWVFWAGATGWALVRAVHGFPPLTMTLWPAVAALAGTAARLVILIVRRQHGTSPLQALDVGALAAICGVLAFTIASQQATTVSFGEAGAPPALNNLVLQSAVEPLSLLAAGATGILALWADGKSKVGIVYFVIGVAPSLLACWALRRFLALPGVDVHLHDTFVEAARLHAGGSAIVCALLAIGHSRFHTLAGRRYREGAAIAAAVPVCVGLHATTVTMFLLGGQGMPLRYAIFPEHFVPYQRNVTMAALVAGVGLLLALLVLALPLARNRARR